MIRAARDADWPALQALYRAAFPDEDLLPLLRELLDAQDATSNYVVDAGGLTGGLTGHIALSLCHASHPVALLGPLAVAPSAQGKGLGTALIAQGCRAMIDAGVTHICVLGDPGYYARHGFAQENQVSPPYPLPPAWAAAWQGRSLAEGPAPTGKLVVPAPWQDPALWA